MKEVKQRESIQNPLNLKQRKTLNSLPQIPREFKQGDEFDKHYAK